MSETSDLDDVTEVLEWFRDQSAVDTIEGELELIREFFERVAACDPSPLERDAAVSEACEIADWFTKKAAHRELSQIRGVDRDT